MTKRDKRFLKRIGHRGLSTRRQQLGMRHTINRLTAAGIIAWAISFGPEGTIYSFQRRRPHKWRKFA